MAVLLNTDHDKAANVAKYEMSIFCLDISNTYAPGKRLL
jgi:hypothetical protein